jgi:hypothetical protein
VIVRSADVVSEAVVGPSRQEPDGSLSSPVTFENPLRGPLSVAKGAPATRVSWHKPDGSSCNLVDLKPGRWMLFLSWAPDGRLAIARCDTHSKPIKGAQAKRKELMAHLSPIVNEADAVAAAALAVRRMLAASVASKESGALAPKGIAAGEVYLARVDRAVTSKQPDGSWLVRWSHHPPAGTSVDAEVRVFPDGVTHVVHADATYSPD